MYILLQAHTLEGLFALYELVRLCDAIGSLDEKLDLASSEAIWSGSTFFFKEDIMAFKTDLIIYVKVYILGWLW